jgi:GTPase SAR1 family protein
MRNSKIKSILSLAKCLNELEDEIQTMSKSIYIYKIQGVNPYNINLMEEEKIEKMKTLIKIESMIEEQIVEIESKNADKVNESFKNQIMDAFQSGIEHVRNLEITIGEEAENYYNSLT